MRKAAIFLALLLASMGLLSCVFANFVLNIPSSPDTNHLAFNIVSPASGQMINSGEAVLNFSITKPRSWFQYGSHVIGTVLWAGYSIDDGQLIEVEVNDVGAGGQDAPRILNFSVILSDLTDGMHKVKIGACGRSLYDGSPPNQNDIDSYSGYRTFEVNTQTDSSDIIWEENAWTTKAGMKTPRTMFGAAAVNGKIYAIGGYPDVNITEEYNPAADTWTAKASMPTGRFNFGITVVQNKIYCIGGLIASQDFYGGSNVSGAIEVYDPATDRWEIKVAMPTPRTHLNAHTVDGKIYLIGGRTGGQYSTVATTEIYDPVSQSWTAKKSMPYPVTSYASWVSQGKIVIFGGQDEFNDPINLDIIQIYDVTDDSWSIGGQMPIPVWNSVACQIANLPNKIFLIGGKPINTNGASDAVQVYDVENDSWSLAESMPTARFDHAGAVIDNSIFVMGGTDNYIFPQEEKISANQMYTVPQTGAPTPTFTVTPSLLLTQNPTSTPTENKTMPSSPFAVGTQTENHAFLIVIVSLSVLIVALFIVFLKKRKGRSS